MLGGCLDHPLHSSLWPPSQSTWPLVRSTVNFHYDLDALHEEFHEHPHTSAEHSRFHEDPQALHEDEHARGSYGDRYDARDPYSGGGRYYDRGY
jgi:hypothetical protein